MATIYCPHCGKEMFDGLNTCPHCGGPVMSPASKKELDSKIEKVIKNEKIWLIGSLIAGIVLGIGILSGMEDAGFVIKLMGVYAYFAFFYGMHCFHPLKRFKSHGIIWFILFGWIVFFVYLYAGAFGGLFYWAPRAIIRLCTRKPLLSDKDIQKLIDKELL